MDLKTLRQIQLTLESQLNTISHQLTAVKNAIRDAERQEKEEVTVSPTVDDTTAVDLKTPKKTGRSVKFYTCTVEGCTRPHIARGLCNLHYTAALREAKKQGIKIGELKIIK